jgi:hypothetical protein
VDLVAGFVQAAGSEDVVPAQQRGWRRQGVTGAATISLAALVSVDLNSAMISSPH